LSLEISGFMRDAGGKCIVPAYLKAAMLNVDLDDAEYQVSRC
jgi:hypothetical protein